MSSVFQRKIKLSKTLVYNALLQKYIYFLHYFRYFNAKFANSKKQDLVHETTDSLLVKEGRVEFVYLFHFY